MSGFTSGTLGRRSLVLRYYDQIRRYNDRPEVFVSCMFQEFKVSAALTYCNVLQERFPKLKRDEGWESALRWLRKQRSDVVQAAPATPSDMANVIRLIDDKKIVTLLVLLYITASRYSDVLDMTIKKRWVVDGAVVLQLDPGHFKSDIFCEKSLYKMLELPGEVWCTEEGVREVLRDPPPYARVLRVLKGILALSHLTLHSFRRGALSELSWEFERSEVAKLSLHADGNESKSVRRYIEVNVNMFEARLQREMVRRLSKAIRAGLEG